MQDLHGVTARRGPQLNRREMRTAREQANVHMVEAEQFHQTQRFGSFQYREAVVCAGEFKHAVRLRSNLRDTGYPSVRVSLQPAEIAIPVPPSTVRIGILPSSATGLENRTCFVPKPLRE